MVLKADAVKDEVLDEVRLILVDVLFKMQDVSLDGPVYDVGEAYS